jgi:beta-N-acetylhexosaminidase
VTSSEKSKNLDERIGQLFIAGMPGLEVDSGTKSLIQNYKIGGIILFSRNIQSPVQLTVLCMSLQKLAIQYQGQPLFLAIDQEGGRVSRLREPFTIFPGNSAMGENLDPLSKATEFASVTAREMGIVGLNMDLAPVIDVKRGELEKHLKGRTFGDDPEKVSSLGTAVIKGLQKNGILAVAKHFPGLGRAQLDPHLHLPVIETDSKEMEEINFPPFKAAIESGVSAIMTSHAIYPAIEPDIPATLSRKALNLLLREKLQFKGLIITDDLEMGAIDKKWGAAQGASLAFEAGSDLLLICENQEKIIDGIKILRNNINNGRIPLQRLEGSVRRINTAKSRISETLKETSLEEVKKYFGYSR